MFLLQCFFLSEDSRNRMNLQSSWEYVFYVQLWTYLFNLILLFVRYLRFELFVVFTFTSPFIVGKCILVVNLLFFNFGIREKNGWNTIFDNGRKRCRDYQMCFDLPTLLISYFVSIPPPFCLSFFFVIKFYRSKIPPRFLFVFVCRARMMIYACDGEILFFNIWNILVGTAGM